MKYFPRTENWRTLVPTSESMDNINNQSLKNPRAPYVAENETDFSWLKNPTCFSIPVFTATYKNMEKFVSKTFKHTISGKMYTEEASHI